jgi:hypothetical protein
LRVAVKREQLPHEEPAEIPHTIMAVMIMANPSMRALTFWLLATKNFVIIASKNGRNSNTIPKIVIIRKM